MSGVAGIIRFDGKPVERAEIEKMTGAMSHRGPDGINHWISDSVGLGQCMLRTTPESLEETQPLANEDENLVLVMDGRVDNWLDLRRELLERGVVLRNRSDTELVLRAYELWGERCLDRIIGECVFFVWDARRQILFGGRDPAGTRHFYYHVGHGWFGFSSEIKGLLALGRIEQRLNESRLVDYLVEDFDRDDEIGTFYHDIVRLPAGHAIQVGDTGVKTWRWWKPSELEPSGYRSLDECAEAFREQLEIAVRCRLRSIRPIGAELSGGLDSSSIVALIGKAYPTELAEPLRTFSLIRSDRENCPDWRSVRHMLSEEWLSPTVITSDLTEEVGRAFLDAIPAASEPFVSMCLPRFVVNFAARASGCGVIIDGMAGDLLFYDYDRSLDAVQREKLYGRLPAVLTAADRHGISDARRLLAWSFLKAIAPDWVRAAYRSLLGGAAVRRRLDPQLLRERSRKVLALKFVQRYRSQARFSFASDQAFHAESFTRGLLSFGHEVSGELAFSCGLETRSPFSDRRMIEFAIRMPAEMKLYAFWYKHLLRVSMDGLLPEAVLWRSRGGGHPGWTFYRSLIEKTVALNEAVLQHAEATHVLRRWVDFEAYARMAGASDYGKLRAALRIFVLIKWLSGHKAIVGDYSRPDQINGGKVKMKAVTPMDHQVEPVTVSERTTTAQLWPVQPRSLRTDCSPSLKEFGQIKDLVKSGTGNKEDESSPDQLCNPGADVKKKCHSDRRLKERIVPIGLDISGIALYLFNYKPEYRDALGRGRRFGVMADEVELVNPDAVSIASNGYKQVDYSMLGIEMAAG